jgi:hypothetical protein
VEVLNEKREKGDWHNRDSGDSSLGRFGCRCCGCSIGKYYSDGTPWYYDINIEALPNILEGSTYGTVYITPQT